MSLAIASIFAALSVCLLIAEATPGDLADRTAKFRQKAEAACGTEIFAAMTDSDWQDQGCFTERKSPRKCAKADKCSQAEVDEAVEATYTGGGQGFANNLRVQWDSPFTFKRGIKVCFDSPTCWPIFKFHAKLAAMQLCKPLFVPAVDGSLTLKIRSALLQYHPNDWWQHGFLA